MIVRVHKGQLNYFRKKARSTPNEIYAALLGRIVNNNLVEIHQFAYPALEESTPTSVTPDTQALEEIEQDAAEAGLTVVGGVHTHPNWSPVLSPADHQHFSAFGDKIVGVVEVTNRRTRIAFWQESSSLPCKLEYF